MARWKNHFSQLLNIHEVNTVGHTEIHTVEPLVPEPSAFEFVLAIEKPKSHKSPGIEQIEGELIKVVGKGVKQFTIVSTNLLFLFGKRRNCLRSGRS